MSTTTHEHESSALISTISVEALLAARDAAQAAFKQAAKMLDAAQEQLDVFGVSLPRVKVEFPGNDYESLQDPRNASAIEQEIDRFVWVRLFELTHIETIMDHETRNELFERLGRSRSRRYGHEPEALPPLTRENIEATLKAVHDNRLEYFEKSVEAVYRSLSWEHKTNEPSRIGEKLIVHGAFYVYPRSLQGDGTSLNRIESLHDLERVLCVLDGTPPPVGGVGLRGLGKLTFGEWVNVPSPRGPEAPPLMRVKLFRKGTAHVEILNQAHVDEMNWIMAKRHPGAIPEPPESRRGRRGDGAQRPNTTYALAKTEKAARQAFYTPAEVADRLVQAAQLTTWAKVLEPSAGEGAIVRAILRARCENVTAIENDPHGLEMLGHLAERVNARRDAPVLRVLGQDFICTKPSSSYDAVVMNPPFARAQEVEHVLHAWEFVKPGGVLVAVMSNAVTFRKDGRYEVFARFLARNKAEIEKLPDGSFEESGTMVATVMVTVRKPKES